MNFQWSPEAIVGAIALSVSTLGWVGTAAVHQGAETSTIAAIQASQSAASAKLDAHQAELAAAAAHNAAVEQKLNDMIDRLDRIEKEVTHERR